MGERIKVCNKCGSRSPATAEFFYRNKNNYDGLHAECKICASRQNYEYRVMLGQREREIVQDLPGEEWEPIVERELLYSISNFGRAKRTKSGQHTHDGKLLKPALDKDGYQVINLIEDGRRRTLKIHRIVLGSFIGQCPEGMQVNHKDGDKTNNCLENLEYVTPSENMRHALKTGLRVPPRGEDQWRSKLTEEDVRKIRLLLTEGVTQRLIADRYNICQSAISKIATGKTWAHVKDE